MKKISRRDAHLTLQFLPLVAQVRWRLWRTPFSRLHSQWSTLVQSELARNGAFETLSVVSGESSAPGDAEVTQEVWRCVHAIRRAARLVPHGSCLTQAMALQLVLARRGQSCAVKIGVDRRRVAPAPTSPLTLHGSDSRGSDSRESEINVPSMSVAAGSFEAHAWVEWRGRVVLGGDIGRWTPLTIFAPAIAAPTTRAPITTAPVSPSNPATSSDSAPNFHPN